MSAVLDESDAAGLSQAIALRYRASDDVEESQRFRRYRCASAETVTAAAQSEMALDIPEHQDIEQAVGDPIARYLVSISGLPAIRQFAAQRKTGLCETLPQPAAFAELEQEMLLQLFIDAGNADEEGR